MICPPTNCFMIDLLSVTKKKQTPRCVWFSYFVHETVYGPKETFGERILVVAFQDVIFGISNKAHTKIERGYHVKSLCKVFRELSLFPAGGSEILWWGLLCL